MVSMIPGDWYWLQMEGVALFSQLHWNLWRNQGGSQSSNKLTEISLAK